MPTAGGKKKLIETFEGSRSHNLALEGKNGYAMPNDLQLAKEKEKKKPTVQNAVDKLPVETGTPEIENGIEPVGTESEQEKPQPEQKPKRGRKNKTKAE